MSPKAKSRFDIPDLGKAPGRRPIRVADAIKHEVAMLLLSKTKDPSLYGVTITEVVLSRDLKNARILFGCDPARRSEVEKGLGRAKGFVRSHLAKELAMRYVPEIQFRYDVRLDKQSEMEKIFQEIAAEDDHPTSE